MQHKNNQNGSQKSCTENFSPLTGLKSQPEFISYNDKQTSALIGDADQGLVYVDLM